MSCHDWLFNKCLVMTDHKPILGLLDKRIDSLPIWLQKWIVEIQSCDVKFEYIPGFRMFFRMVSVETHSIRHLSHIDDTEYTVCFLLHNLPLSIKDVTGATAADPLLQSVLIAMDGYSLAQQLCPSSTSLLFHESWVVYQSSLPV